MDPMTDDYIGKVRELAAKIHAEASRPDWEGCTLRELIDELYDLIHDVEGLFTAQTDERISAMVQAVSRVADVHVVDGRGRIVG